MLESLRRSFLWSLAALAALLVVPAAAREAAGNTIGLEEALTLAFQRSPVLVARRAELDEQKALVVTARTYPYNPEVSAEGAGRSGPDGKSRDRILQVSQEVEIGGQRGRRVVTAAASLAAAEAQFLRHQQLLAGSVALAFIEAVRARELLAIDEADAALAQALLQTEQRRLEAGNATQIDLNLARAAAGRSGSRVELAKGAYLDSRSALASVIGLSPASPPEPVGDLDAGLGDSTAALPALADLVAAALEKRPDLVASLRQVEAARAEIALQRSLVVPNLVASAFSEREADRDDINGLGLSVAIPLFDRNRGGIAAATAHADAASAESAAARLAAEQEVTSAFAAYRAAGAAARALGDQVIGSLEENLRLVQRSLEEGKISRTDLFLFRREFVESQREYVDAASEAWRARVLLDLAAGRLPVPVQPSGSVNP